MTFDSVPPGATTPPSLAGSWFGALPEPDPGTGSPDAKAEAAGGDSLFMARQARRLEDTRRDSVQRIYRSFLTARALLGIALVFTLVGAAVAGSRPPLPVLVLSVLFAAWAVSMWLVPRLGMFQDEPAGTGQMRHLSWRQGVMTIGVDSAIFVALHALSGGNLNYAALLAMPVLMAGALAPRTLALGVAATLSVALLVVAVQNVVAGHDVVSLITSAGLVGLALFVVALLTNELALRLAREEATARGSLEMARQQAQLSRLVTQEMQEGVMVVDRRGRVRSANPAARALLVPDGMLTSEAFHLHDDPAWAPLVRAMEQAFAGAGSLPADGQDVRLMFTGGVARSLRVRMRFVQRRERVASGEYCVLFLEDVRTVQARTRQEKLAAMGRMSAGIAHEIRNPLAAIAQANALLAEEVAEPGQRQLTTMVTANVERLKRIVDDVMEVVPGATSGNVRISLVAEMRTICTEWAAAHGLGIGEGERIRLELPEERVDVRFDPHHLQRVLVNLLENAVRHGSGLPGSAWVLLRLEDGMADMSVLSDGLPIDAGVEPYLFEPFFSTRSRGTGLGLYVCRELCERHGATIEYRTWPDTTRYRNEFVVHLPVDHPGAPLAAATSTFTTR